VSIATVSRTFNTPEKVRPEVRRRIEDAATSIDYAPNVAAKALSLSRNFRIGAAIPTIENSIFARFVQALGDSLRDAGYGLSLGMFEYDKEREFEVVRSLIASGIDGLALSGTERSQDTCDLLATKGVPHVLTSILDPGPGGCAVGYDNALGSYMVTEHLLKLGHRRFAVIAGETDINDRARLRLDGVEKALADWGVRLPRRAVKHATFTIRNGRTALRELAVVAPEATAVICGNDVLAVGALFEAQACGLRVPEDLSIVGFDGIDLAGEVEPPLTTVAVPCDEMGRRAAQTLLSKIHNPDFTATIQLELALVAGGSVAEPAAGLRAVGAGSVT
jgi:LacI family transcriptional regulator